MEIEVTEPQTEEEFERYYRLRWERLRKPHDEPFGSERDSPHEAKSKHLIAKVDGRIVGAETYVFLQRRESRLRRSQLVVRSRQTAIDPEFERSGVASALIKHVEEAGRKEGAVYLIGNVRENAIPWAKSLGYDILDEGTTLYDNVKSVAVRKRL